VTDTVRRPIVAGNWKMNTTFVEAVDLADALGRSIGDLAAVDRVLCPPFVWIPAVAERLRGSSIGLGAQNVHWEEKGAFTGEVAPPMLAGLCSHVIVGHSERRQHFCDDDSTVNKKVRAVLRAGLVPIMCLGENLGQNEAGQTLEVVGRQVRAGLDGLEPTDRLVIAYEPIWAIGTGRPATAEGANEVIGAIRRVVAATWSGPAAAAIRIQYGGSVTAANAAELFAQPEIDGALVGGASLRAADFAAIVQAAAGAS
jgi:triosephosphate isomerase (TIM)